MPEASPRPSRGIPRPIEAGVAAAGLLAVSPLLAILWLLVRTTSRGPGIYRQMRVGRGGGTFPLYKLRTMRASADGPQVTARGDRRITAVGKFLRRSKLDELPQLWNVVRGDMSLVGPRPEVPRYVDRGDADWVEVLRVRPGITDPCTLELRDEEAILAAVPGDPETYYREKLLPEKLRQYRRYIDTRSFGTDVEVLYKTVLAVLFPGRPGFPPDAAPSEPAKSSSNRV